MNPTQLFLQSLLRHFATLAAGWFVKKGLTDYQTAQNFFSVLADSATAVVFVVFALTYSHFKNLLLVKYKSELQPTTPDEKTTPNP